jgi:hypothetical protein
MKKIVEYKDFINEGKISQFVLNAIFTTQGYASMFIKKLKGGYIPFDFKDKKLEKKLQSQIIELFDYALFDNLKYHFGKKYRETAKKTSLSDLIKTRSGVDVYQLADSILDELKIENIKIPVGKEKKTTETLEKSIETVKKLIAIVKKTDDEIEDEKQFIKDLAELGELFKGLDPRTMHLRDKDDSLAAFDKVGSKLDDMQEPKELDYILDKISKFGMSSLTSQEKADLEKLSK